MNHIVDVVTKMYKEIVDLPVDPAKKYFMLNEKYPDAVKAYPLVMKYMCFYGYYNPDIFRDYLEDASKKRPTYEQGFELQAEYIKKILLWKGYSRIEAKKASNQELDEVIRQIRKIQKQERTIKKRNELEKKQNIDEIRKEFNEFVLKQND